MAFLLPASVKDRNGRDVSPLGASRFERPFAPMDYNLSNDTSPTSRGSADVLSHYSKPSDASTNLTNFTKATSISTFDFDFGFELRDLSSPACTLHEEPDNWSAIFHSDLDPEFDVSDECPDRATLAAVQEIPVYDAEGIGRPFRSLHDPKQAVHQRQLMVFVRHFYCGACQAYLKALTEGISRQDYFSIPIPTSIIVIGCGQPDLIPHYKAFTGCPYPMFADPSRLLFKRLGMNLSLNIGRERPEYMKDISPHAWLKGQATTIRKSLKDPDGIRRKDIFRGGNPMQIGGEFLFNEGEVVWCHRMRHYRNHAEVTLVRKLLELDEW